MKKIKREKINKELNIKNKVNQEVFCKWYTRIIGIYFLLIIISLILDFTQYGHRPETWHKIFHILIGLIIIYNWNNKNFYRHFTTVNGAFFTFIAIFGLVFPNFALQRGLEAFTRSDTILHTIVGIVGLLVGIRIKNN